MAKKGIWVQLDKDAFRDQVLRSDNLRRILDDKAKEIASRCGDGYRSKSSIEENRAMAMVWTSTQEAKLDNEENNTLLKNVKG